MSGIRSEKPPPASKRRRRWAELIRLVFEVDPLRCDKCRGEMKIIAFISTAQDQVIRQILAHLGLRTVIPRPHGPPGRRHLQHHRKFASGGPVRESWIPHFPNSERLEGINILIYRADWAPGLVGADDRGEKLRGVPDRDDQSAGASAS